MFQEAELPVRVILDLFLGDFEGAVVDPERRPGDPGLPEADVAARSPDASRRTADQDSLIERPASTTPISSTLGRRVDLPRAAI